MSTPDSLGVAGYNRTLELLPSAAYDSDQTLNLKNKSNSGIHVILDVTDIGGMSLRVTIKGKDPASGEFYNLLVGQAVSSNTTKVERVSPKATAGNDVANNFVPLDFQILVEDTSTAWDGTYSLGVQYV